MPLWLVVAGVLLSFGLPLLLGLWSTQRDWRFRVLLGCSVLSGWLLLVCIALAAKYAHDADVYERQSLAMPVTLAEYAQDGTGENALALALGWLVPATGGAVGLAVAKLRRSRETDRRGFAVVSQAAKAPGEDA